MSTALACATLFSLSANAATSNARLYGGEARAMHSGTSEDSSGLVVADEWEELPASGAAAGAADDSRGAGDAKRPAPRRGSANAPVTIVEYTDFQCPACRAAEPGLEAVCSKYGRRVNRVHKDFPLNYHHHAMTAAVAARCAGEQGQFWAYHDALLTGPAQLSVPALKQLAAQLNLDSASFNACLDDRRYASAVAADMSEGDHAGVHATPTLVVNGRQFVGMPSTTTLDAAIGADLHTH